MRDVASGMWTAVSGATARQAALDAVANNLANQDTLGFKKDAPTFKEYLSTIEREPAALEPPRGQIKDKDFYPLDGRDQSHVVVDGTYTNFKQGPLKVTKNPLDVALEGPGFLEVSTPNGIRYTRQGSLKLAMDGRLVNSQGYPVLAAQPGGLAAALPAATAQPSQGGPVTQGGVTAEPGADVQARFINLADLGGRLSVNERGELYAGDRLIARMNVVEFQSPQQLKKHGGTLFEDEGGRALAQPAQDTAVRQGMLEGSNVNPVEEMTNMIRASRMYEQDMKSLKTYGELLGREANDIGKL